MKKSFILSVVIAVLCLSISGQAQSRRIFDNFDTSKGVQVVVKPVEVSVKPLKTNKKNQAPVQTGKTRVQAIVMQRNASAPKLEMSAGKTLGNFSTGDVRIDNFILTSSARHNVNPLLIYATMSQESGFKPRALTYKGARGLMQLMPATAVRFGVTNIFDPQQNIEGGVKYLRWLLNTFSGDVRLALAGYNAGEGAVMKYGYTIPPYTETQNYVRRITARYEMLRNPVYAQNVARVASAPVSPETSNKTIKPLSTPPPPLYEPSVSPIRLPNGKIQLVSQ